MRAQAPRFCLRLACRCFGEGKSKRQGTNRQQGLAPFPPSDFSSRFVPPSISTDPEAALQFWIHHDKVDEASLAFDALWQQRHASPERLVHTTGALETDIETSPISHQTSGPETSKQKEATGSQRPEALFLNFLLLHRRFAQAAQLLRNLIADPQAPMPSLHALLCSYLERLLRHRPLQVEVSEELVALYSRRVATLAAPPPSPLSNADPPMSRSSTSSPSPPPQSVGRVDKVLYTKLFVHHTQCLLWLRQRIFSDFSTQIASSSLPQHQPSPDPDACSLPRHQNSAALRSPDQPDLPGNAADPGSAFAPTPGDDNYKRSSSYGDISPVAPGAPSALETVFFYKSVFTVSKQ